jgi:hypothetical protein
MTNWNINDLVELDIVAVQMIRHETVPSATFKRKK